MKISGVAVHRLPQLAFAPSGADWVSSIQDEAVVTVPASDRSTCSFASIEFSITGQISSILERTFRPVNKHYGVYEIHMSMFVRRYFFMDIRVDYETVWIVPEEPSYTFPVAWLALIESGALQVFVPGDGEHSGDR